MSYRDYIGSRYHNIDRHLLGHYDIVGQSVPTMSRRCHQHMPPDLF